MSGLLICRTDCLNADLAVRLLVINFYDYLCVTFTRLGTVAILATLTLDRYDEQTVESGKDWICFDRIVPAGHV